MSCEQRQKKTEVETEVCRCQKSKVIQEVMRVSRSLQLVSHLVSGASTNSNSTGVCSCVGSDAIVAAGGGGGERRGRG